MHGIRRQKRIDFARRHDLRLHGQAAQLVHQTAMAIFRRQNLAHLALGIAQRFDDRVPAIQHHLMVKPRRWPVGPRTAAAATSAPATFRAKAEFAARTGAGRAARGTAR